MVNAKLKDSIAIRSDLVDECQSCGKERSRGKGKQSNAANRPSCRFSKFTCHRSLLQSSGFNVNSLWSTCGSHFWISSRAEKCCALPSSQHSRARAPAPHYLVLASVDVEAQDCVYFNRLLAAKYGAEFPVG